MIGEAIAIRPVAGGGGIPGAAAVAGERVMRVATEAPLVRPNGDAAAQRARRP